MQKVIAIVGPTATGKSELGVELAKRFDGEVVSADSRQVYKGLDIGTGKVPRDPQPTIPTLARGEIGTPTIGIGANNQQLTTKVLSTIYWHAGVPHHLLDVADRRDYFSVVDYKRLAESAIDNILSRGKLPIIVGGTGLYIHAVVDNVTYPAVPPNKELREHLKNKTALELTRELEKLDPEYPRKIDRGNPRRLARAIEIAVALGRVPKPERRVPHYAPLLIGLYLPPEELKKGIRKRLLDRLEHGMIEEAEHLHARGLSWKRMEQLGLEYRYLARFLQNKISREQTAEQLATEIWRYAKRQMTWFKRDPRIKWFQPFDRNTIVNLTGLFLS